MFGKAGLGGLMKQAQQMQENMKKAQAKLAETEVEGEAGNGLVKVVMTCAHVVRKLEISPDLIQEAADDKEMLEDLVLAAINAASEKSRRNHQQNHGCIHPRPARRHGRFLQIRQPETPFSVAKRIIRHGKNRHHHGQQQRLAHHGTRRQNAATIRRGL